VLTQVQLHNRLHFAAARHVAFSEPIWQLLFPSAANLLVERTKERKVSKKVSAGDTRTVVMKKRIVLLREEWARDRKWEGKESKIRLTGC
jgi:hypothetical protein